MKYKGFSTASIPSCGCGGCCWSVSVTCCFNDSTYERWTCFCPIIETQVNVLRLWGSLLQGRSSRGRSGGDLRFHWSGCSPSDIRWHGSWSTLEPRGGGGRLETAGTEQMFSILWPLESWGCGHSQQRNSRTTIVRHVQKSLGPCVFS